MKKFSLLLIVILVFAVNYTYASEKNLFVDSEESIFGLSASYEDSIITNGLVETSLVYISIPHLTKDYTFKGHVKIVELGSSPWNGIRFVIGSNSIGQDSKIVVTKEWDTRVEFIMNNMDDLMGSSIVLVNGTEFDFEVTRSGQNFVFQMDDTIVLDSEISLDFDAFEEGYEYNLGFESSDCHYEITNIEVYCEDAENVTPTPQPTETIAPTEEVVDETMPVETMDKVEEPSEESKISFPVIVILVVASILVVAVVVIVIKDKKNKK